MPKLGLGLGLVFNRATLAAIERVFPGYYTWTNANLPTGTWTDVEYCDHTGTLIAVGNNRYSYSLDDGITWATPIVPINPLEGGTEIYNALACNHSGMWVIMESRNYAPYGSSYVYTTFDPTTGVSKDSTFTDPVSTLQFFDLIHSSHHGKFIATGSKQNRYNNDLVGAYSTNGINWLSANYLNVNGVPLSDSGGFDAGLVEGTYMPNHRLVVCGSGASFKFGYSDDGITWRQGKYQNNQDDIPNRNNLQTSCSWSDVAYGFDGGVNLPPNGRYVAVNSNKAGAFPIGYSDDGINWYGVTTPDLINKRWKTITYVPKDRVFVALEGNDSGEPYADASAYSYDGINWNVHIGQRQIGEAKDVCVAGNRLVAVLWNAPAPVGVPTGAMYTEQFYSM